MFAHSTDKNFNEHYEQKTQRLRLQFLQNLKETFHHIEGTSQINFKTSLTLWKNKDWNSEKLFAMSQQPEAHNIGNFRSSFHPFHWVLSWLSLPYSFPALLFISYANLLRPRLTSSLVNCESAYFIYFTQ